MKRLCVVAALLVCALLLSGAIHNAEGRGQRRRAARPPAQPGAANDPSLAGLRQYIADVMRRLPVVPGLAVAVVRGDRVVFAAGFGYRDVRRQLPVTPQTQFYIASTTKSFTATAARLLADEAKFDLDAPIKTYFPDLKLPAPLSTEQISVRDLLTHRHGIGNEPIEFRTAYTGQYDDAEIFRLLSEQTRPIPPVYTYSNVGYIVAGYAMQRATGDTWQQIVRRKVLDPLGLNATTCSASQARASADYALPYLADGGAFIELPYKQDNTMHAAGGMVSNAEDLARWIVVNMNGGRLAGRQLLPAAALEEILAPQINQKRTFYKYERYAYTLGWNIATYEGDKLIHCFGTYEGFRPHVSFMPAHRLGVVVLGNESRDGVLLPDLIATEIYDHLLRGAPLRVQANPKIEEFEANLRKSREARAKRAAAHEQERATHAPPTLAPAAYAGTYENPALGRIRIVADAGDTLSARFGNFAAPLAHFNRDEFEVTFIPGNTGRLGFKADKDGSVAGLTMMGQAFTRVK